MTIANIIKPGDWVSVRHAVAQLDRKLGYGSSPTFAGLTLTGFSGVLKATVGVIAGGATTSDMPEGTNLYYTDARARVAISETITGLDYNNTTGVLSLTTGYVIPTTTEESNWNSAYGSLHAAVTLTTSADVLLGLTGQQLSLDIQVATRVLAGPATGADAAPTFRALVSTDIPTLAYDATGTAAGIMSSHTSTYDHTLLHTVATISDSSSINFSITGQEISGVVLPAGVDHNSLNNYASNRHFLQTDIVNISTALSTGLVKVTTGTGALSIITDNSSNWDSAYSSSHAILTLGTANGLSLVGQQLSLPTTATPSFSGLSLILTGDTYKFFTSPTATTRLGLTSQLTGSPGIIELFSKDGDGTDESGCLIWARGTEVSTSNGEWGAFYWMYSQQQFTFRTGHLGGGSDRPLSLKAGATGGEVWCRASSAQVGINNIDPQVSCHITGVTRIDDSTLTASRLAAFDESKNLISVISGNSLSPTLAGLYLSNTIYDKLLIHFDGSDAATTYTAETGQVITFVGDTQLDTAQKKFGVSSLLLDGTGDYCTLVDSSNWHFGSGNFTIECWAYLNEAMGAGTRGIFGLGGGIGGWGSSGHEWILFTHTDSKLYFQYNKGGYNGITSTGTIDVDAGWHHFAVVRNGGTITLYVDGTSVGSGAITGAIDTISGGTPILVVGNDASVDMSWKGWIDEVRFSKGIARWTTNFTPITGPYTLIKTGATQAIAGAITGEIWVTAGHATMADGALMMGY